MVLAIAMDARGVPADILAELRVTGEVVRRLRALLTAEDYGNACIALDAGGQFVGWPTKDDQGQWWIRLPNGRLELPEEVL